MREEDAWRYCRGNSLASHYVLYVCTLVVDYDSLNETQTCYVRSPPPRASRVAIVRSALLRPP